MICAEKKIRGVHQYNTDIKGQSYKIMLIVNGYIQTSINGELQNKEREGFSVAQTEFHGRYRCQYKLTTENPTSRDGSLERKTKIHGSALLDADVLINDCIKLFSEKGVEIGVFKVLNIHYLTRVGLIKITF